MARMARPGATRSAASRSAPTTRRAARARRWPPRVPGPSRAGCDRGRSRYTPRRVAMRVTQKGQVTIPLAIRERVGILPDTRGRVQRPWESVILRRRAVEDGEAASRPGDARPRDRWADNRRDHGPDAQAVGDAPMADILVDSNVSWTWRRRTSAGSAGRPGNWRSSGAEHPRDQSHRLRRGLDRVRAYRGSGCDLADRRRSAARHSPGRRHSWRASASCAIGEAAAPSNRPLPDFFIGAARRRPRHVAAHERPSHYRTYFPRVPLISPQGSDPSAT